jgi:hypothetical protein
MHFAGVAHQFLLDIAREFTDLFVKVKATDERHGHRSPAEFKTRHQRAARFPLRNMLPWPCPHS